MNKPYFFNLVIMIALLSCLQTMCMEPIESKYALKNFFNEQKEQEYEQTHMLKGVQKEKLDQQFPLIFDEKGAPIIKNTTCLNYDGGVYSSPFIPDYIIKSADKKMYNYFQYPPVFLGMRKLLDRLCGLELLQTCISDLGLNKVGCPTKELYTDPRSGRMYVVARKIVSSNKPFSLEQTVQLYKLVKTSSYVDVKPGGLKENILNGTDGVAYIIDTEKRSFEKMHPMVGGVSDLSYLNLDSEAKKFMRSKLMGPDVIEREGLQKYAAM